MESLNVASVYLHGQATTMYRPQPFSAHIKYDDDDDPRGEEGLDLTAVKSDKTPLH